MVSTSVWSGEVVCVCVCVGGVGGVREMRVGSSGGNDISSLVGIEGDDNGMGCVFTGE